MRLNEEQRKLWSDKLMDLANLIVVALVFGQFISPLGYNPFLVASGIMFYIAMSIGAIKLRA